MKSHLTIIFLLIATISNAEEAKKIQPPILHEYFNVSPNGDATQCGNIGHHSAALGEWLPQIIVDTDNKTGGCMQSFSIEDPDEILGDMQITLSWTADKGGDPKQCGGPDSTIIPITKNGQTTSQPIFLDMDNRRGGCNQKFVIEKNKNYGLEVYMEPNGDASQCHGATLGSVAKLNSPITIGLDTDNKNGGCIVKYRLVKL
ncbi:hypothetical protein [Chromobacterium rhizoryzae]|uniref:hypothetical protein n=1 Tax=Chromobacterium rhizoryzae TaxID=1778675 RepID=UPI001D07F112|nr:hypothetical protein [Chromobacterium rhizoryzae]